MRVRVSASPLSNKLVPPQTRPIHCDVLNRDTKKQAAASCCASCQRIQTGVGVTRAFFYCCIGNNSSTLTEDSSLSQLRAEEYQQRVSCVCFQRFFKPLTRKHAKLCIREGDTFSSFGEFSRLYEFDFTEKLQTACWMVYLLF